MSNESKIKETIADRDLNRAFHSGWKVMSGEGIGRSVWNTESVAVVEECETRQDRRQESFRSLVYLVLRNGCDQIKGGIDRRLAPRLETVVPARGLFEGK